MVVIGHVCEWIAKNSLPPQCTGIMGVADKMDEEGMKTIVEKNVRQICRVWLFLSVLSHRRSR